MEKLQSIDTEAESKYKEKGSLFLGKAYPVTSKEEAEKILEKIRKEFFDATHHCYAYKIFGGTEKYSDDGEPNGTAGIRILNAINHFNLINVLLIVIRYFGGTKLGVGPLGNAYYQTAHGTLENAQKRELGIFKLARITFDYEHSNQVHRLLNLFKAREIRNDFLGNRPVIHAHIPVDEYSRFTKTLEEATKRQIEIEEGEISLLKVE